MDKVIEVAVMAMFVLIIAAIVLFPTQSKSANYTNFLDGQKDGSECQVLKTQNKCEEFERKGCAQVYGTCQSSDPENEGENNQNSGSSGGGGTDFVEGDVTTDITREATGGNSDVVSKSDSSFTLTPEESPDFNDYIVWQPLPEGEKKVEIVLEFERKGHLQIDAQEESGDGASETVSYINTDARGFENVFVQKASGEYTDTGFDYSTDTEYTIVLERTNGQIKWEIIQDGDVEWSYTDQSSDFRRLVLESWESWSGGATQNPQLEVRKVDVTDR